ncbi:hypothetical protein CIRMBP1197_02291 [Enterococcus cecorum]|nr:hypothetical protein CIRMBP1197_02291 [Enterococcus cecorum]
MLESLQNYKPEVIDYMKLEMDLKRNKKIMDSYLLKVDKIKKYFEKKEVDKYTTSINNYFINYEQIQLNTEIFNREELNDFWNLSKKYLKQYIALPNYCPVCGIAFRNEFNFSPTIEHVFPKSKYQQYIILPSNLVYFCKQCNSRKGNKLEDKVFHPYFSQINCNCEIHLKFVIGNDEKNYFKISVRGENEDINYFIKLFNIKNTYKSFIEQIINREISSIELLFQNKLESLNEQQSIDKISNYLIQSYTLDLNYAKTEDEKKIVEELSKLIKQYPNDFARYIVERSTFL